MSAMASTLRPVSAVGCRVRPVCGMQPRTCRRATSSAQTAGRCLASEELDEAQCGAGSALCSAFDPAGANIMHTAQPAIADLAEGLETPVQLIYLSLLVVLLSGAAFIVVRQVLVQREMDERSKVLSELIRTGEATSEDYFELGVVLARRKLFTQALKNYNKAIKLWDGDETELAQVHNAMGYCYQNTTKPGDAIKQYQQATQLQPGYVTAWNNLGDVLEKQGRWKDALPAYESAFELEPNNETARLAVERLRTKATRMGVM